MAGNLYHVLARVRFWSHKKRHQYLVQYHITINHMAKMDGVRLLLSEVFTLKNTIGNSDGVGPRKAYYTNGANTVSGGKGNYGIFLMMGVHS